MKKVFSYNPDTNKTAYLNWRTEAHEPIHNMNVLAEGYFQAATLLAEQCLNDNFDKKADAVIFPMLFSVNQGIELYVKSICWSLNILLGYNSKYKENHDIRGIWLTAKDKIKEFGFDSSAGRGEKEFNQKIKTLEAYLNELTDLLKKGNDKNNAYHNIDFSRYPVNNQNEYHFYVKQYDNVVVDLENFIKVFDDISDCLESLADYYYGLVVDSWQTE